MLKNIFESLKERTVFEPHSLNALCLFAVLTRLRHAQAKHYPEKKLEGDCHEEENMPQTVPLQLMRFKN